MPIETPSHIIAQTQHREYQDCNRDFKKYPDSTINSSIT